MKNEKLKNILISGLHFLSYGDTQLFAKECEKRISEADHTFHLRLYLKVSYVANALEPVWFSSDVNTFCVYWSWLEQELKKNKELWSEFMKMRILGKMRRVDTYLYKIS